MAARGLQLVTFRAALDPAALARRQVKMRVEHLVLRVSTTALELMIPPQVPLRLEHLAGGRARFNVEIRGIPGTLELEPVATAQGRLRLEIASIRAAGFLPIPPSIVAPFLRGRLPNVPGVYLSADNRIEVDVREMAAPFGVELPPLRGVKVDGGLLELDFGSTISV
jgi:hypothetical protein